MMEYELILRWLHVLGACVLLGTGAGIAFFMFMAHRSQSVEFIARVGQTVVIADFIFTASAVLVQPVTGLLLAQEAGWPLTEGWIVLSVLLYLFIGLCWLPVVWLQIQMRNEAVMALEKGSRLPQRYFVLFRCWFWLGVPAFLAILGILWLMVARPSLGIEF
jgi:uncharacterized membrane protein